MIKEYVAVLWNSKERVSEDVYVEVKDDVKLQNTLAEAEKKALAYAKEKFGWPEEETICISLNSVSLNLPKGRKVIGTCRECRWWSKGERFCGRWYGKCSYDGSSNVLFETGEDFGCIHWERKE